MKTLQDAPLKMPNIYILSLRQIQDRIHQDWIQVRKRLKANGLKVYDEKRTPFGIEASYISRGYNHTFSMIWTSIKTEIEQYLSEYMNVDLADNNLN